MIAEIRDFVNSAGDKISNGVKRWGKIIILATVIFLMVSLAFSLGFIMGGKIIHHPPLVINKELIINPDEITPQASQGGHQFVASSRGKYYYPIDCSLAENLSEANKIFFSSKEEAESRGYIFQTKCQP